MAQNNNANDTWHEIAMPMAHV